MEATLCVALVDHEVVDHEVQGDQGGSHWRSLTALRTLLEATEAHANLPPETSRCLARMAVRLQELTEAVGRLESACITRSDDPSRESSGLTLRELVGDDLLDELAHGGSHHYRPGDADRRFVRSRPLGKGVAGIARLTPQEQRILELIAEGCTNRQIAARLYLAEKTVKNYVSNLLRKLGMERRTQAAVYAAHLDRAASTPGGAA